MFNDNNGLDPADYLEDLADIDMTEDQKHELLIILHDILSHFVQMGFDLKDTDVCGQLFGDFMDAASGGPDGLESVASTTSEAPADQTKEEDFP